MNIPKQAQPVHRDIREARRVRKTRQLFPSQDFVYKECEDLEPNNPNGTIKVIQVNPGGQEIPQYARKRYHHVVKTECTSTVGGK
jgi:hypothetical protein